MAGPKDGTFNAGPFTLDRMSYVSCDGPKRLRLTTEIALTGTAADPSARNFSTFISPGGALNTYWLIWKKCP